MAVNISNLTHGRLPEREEFDGFRSIFKAHATAGYSIVLNYTRSGPEYVESHYDPEWQAEYDRKRLYWRDPVLMWAMASDGNKRWSSVPIPDLGGVMKKARRYGLVFGGAFARSSNFGKSLLSVARDDRELSDNEIEALSAALDQLLLTLGDRGLTEKEVAVLRCLSEDMSHDQVAKHLNISASAVKLRLNSARQRLGTNTTYGALREAIRQKLI